MSSEPRTHVVGAETAGSGSGLAALLLAAGQGRRLRPLTEERPKPLCPVGASTLLDRALARLQDAGLVGADHVAVNAHHLAEQVVSAVGDRAHVSIEQPQALGTAGAVGRLRAWLAGRAVLIGNADAYLDGSTDTLLAGWTGERPRLLVVDDADRGDFGRWRFAGLSLLPAADAARLSATPSGLYEEVWQAALADNRCDLVQFGGVFIDCGTPADYLAANLHASRGHSVVGAGAQIAGQLTRSVVWPAGTVSAGEHLIDAIRTTAGRTVHVGQP